MLRASTADQSADLLVVTEGASRNDGAVPQAAELLAFAEAVHARDAAATEAAGKGLVSTLGEDALVDSAAVCAQFDAITRVADATGVQLDRGLESGSEEIRAELGLNAFNTTLGARVL